MMNPKPGQPARPGRGEEPPLKRLTPSHARRAAAPAALALTAALALSACSHSADDAAIVNGYAITVDQAQTVAREYNELTGQSGANGATPDKTLAVFIEGHFALQEQSKAGQGVSADDARRIMKDQMQVKDPSPTLVNFYRNVIAVEAARQDPAATKKVQAAIEKADITINPRYGSSFDVKQRTVLDPQPDWIKPFEAAKPQADSQSSPTPTN
jgi:uncharacterized protein YpmB